MKRWRFVSNQNSTLTGINDAGIETFSANMHRSLVREILQNALDATIPGCSEPTRVEFSLFTIPTKDFPDYDDFVDAVKKCKDSNCDEPDASRFFNNAYDILQKNQIDVLRISDYHTIGLEGSDTCQKGSSWSRLVKENGSSNKGQGSGGSFGIGKSAAFTCSDLRTVFYSSMDCQGNQSNFGVARLVSFEDPMLGWTTGVGYYSEDERFVAIPELSTLDKDHVRDTSGTDIYILGMHHEGNLAQVLIKSVLLDFLVSIVNGKLEVVVQGHIIDKTSLAAYITKLNPYESKEIKDLLEYYHILTSPDPAIVKIPLDKSIYGKKYGFEDGECTLYLREGEGLNRRVLITRKAGMRLFEQDRFIGSIDFTGVLYIEGDKMNETFKAMEVPSHDAWEPGRCRTNRKYYENVFDDLKRYLKNQVKECFLKPTGDVIDAFGASDFLPDRVEESGQEALKKTELSPRIKQLFGKKKAPSKRKVRQLELIQEEPPQNGGDTPGQGKKQDGKTKLPSLPGSSQSGDKVGYKKIDVAKRLLGGAVSSGKYQLRMLSPSTAKHGKIVLSISGEQSDLALPIRSAVLQATGQKTTVTKISGNEVYLEDLKKGQQLVLDLEVDFDDYCMMEADYYASKK